MALLMRIGAAALLISGLAAASAAAQEDQSVGTVVRTSPEVKWRRGQGPQKDLKEKEEAPAYVGMEIQTFKKPAGALITLNRKQKGTVTLGWKTIVEITKRLVNDPQDLAKMSWLVKLGYFRLALFPPPPGEPPQEGEYIIQIPDGSPDGIVIRLQGTDVAVQVDKNGTTTIWVMEGTVKVTAAGVVREVEAGSSTRVRPGRAPAQPVPFRRAAGPAPGHAPRPGETIFTDPPRLDLRAIRLDLPF